MKPWRRVLDVVLVVLLVVVVPCSAAVAAAGESSEASPSPAAEPDTIPPVTTASVADGLWFAAPVAVTLTAADEGSGVAYTEYSLDGGDWLRGNEVLLAAPAGHSFDGPHTLLFRSADAADNLEQAESLAVGIDTARPTTRAPSAVSVMRYRTASLPYRVLDRAPNGGVAAVTIRIRDHSGRLVKTLSYAAKPVNTPLAASFACGLPRGSYRFLIYARDQAGNRQATVGSNRLTVRAPWSSGLAFRFRVVGLSLRAVEPATYPFMHIDQPLPLVDDGTHDEYGVRMSRYGGRLYDHVSAQASYGLQNLASYTVTGDAFYLTRAEAQAQRLISRHRLSGTAWFHPNDFSWPRMTPPWYSALGHGLCLPLFTSLFQATGDAAYEEAAQGTFRSFLRRGPSSAPWIVSVDASGYLWLQEYPNRTPDAVLNGHIISAFGLYDYYRATNDPRALELFKGAATTVLHYASWFRQPGWRSFYRFSRDLVTSPKYHFTHVNQFKTLYRLTGNTAFIRFADAFLRDYPKPEVDGSIRVAPGTYTGVQFGLSGRVVGTRTRRAATTITLPVTRRERLYNQPGYWFTTTEGPWTGYYLREQSGRVFLPGVLPVITYDPPRTLVFPVGHVYVGRTYDADGRIAASLRFAPDIATKATADQRAIVNGVDQVRVASGALEGYWLHLGPATLR